MPKPAPAPGGVGSAPGNETMPPEVELVALPLDVAALPPDGEADVSPDESAAYANGPQVRPIRNAGRTTAPARPAPHWREDTSPRCSVSGPDIGDVTPPSRRTTTRRHRSRAAEPAAPCSVTA